MHFKLLIAFVEDTKSDKVMEADPQRKWKIIDRTPMRIFGQPEDIGWAAVYLCSPAAKFISGVVLPVDGGACAGF